MNGAERNFSVSDKKTLAVIFALEKFRISLLSSQPFEIVTDHQALQSAFKKKNICCRLVRWLYFLLEHKFKIDYNSDASKQVADVFPWYGEEESVQCQKERVKKTKWWLVVAAQDSRNAFWKIFESTWRVRLLKASNDLCKGMWKERPGVFSSGTESYSEERL